MLHNSVTAFWGHEQITTLLKKKSGYRDMFKNVFKPSWTLDEAV